MKENGWSAMTRSSRVVAILVIGLTRQFSRMIGMKRLWASKFVLAPWITATKRSKTSARINVFLRQFLVSTHCETAGLALNCDKTIFQISDITVVSISSASRQRPIFSIRVYGRRKFLYQVQKAQQSLQKLFDRDHDLDPLLTSIQRL